MNNKYKPNIPQQTQKKIQGMAKIEKERETVKPTVINDNIIKQYLVNYNRENHIFDKDDMALWHLEHLSLSYKNIIEINNLMGLDKLTNLQLDNNIICKIQNIDHLTNLKWLDLSFNLISKIEGLD
jgi:Leucine-rich repeat (LRR) protein